MSVSVALAPLRLRHELASLGPAEAAGSPVLGTQFELSSTTGTSITRLYWNSSDG
jgi:hypothetical protein